MIPEPIIDRPTAKIQQDEVIIHLPTPYETSEDIRIPTENKVVVKAVLFTLLQNQMCPFGKRMREWRIFFNFYYFFVFR